MYELALTCAQIAQVDNFELFVRTDYSSNLRNDDTAVNVIYATDGSGTETERTSTIIQKQQQKQLKQQWNLVVRSTDESNNGIKLKRIKKQRKPPLQVLKLVDCNEVLIGYFFNILFLVHN